MIIDFVTNLRPAGHGQHCAHRHEEQSLEDHVGEGVGYRAVHRQSGPDPDAGDHEPYLVDH